MTDRSERPESLRSLGNPDGVPILFLAGFGDDGTMYEPLAGTILADVYRLVLVDLPGCGR